MHILNQPKPCPLLWCVRSRLQLGRKSGIHQFFVGCGCQPTHARVAKWQVGHLHLEEAGSEQRSARAPLTCMQPFCNLRAVHSIVGQDYSRHGISASSRALLAEAMLGVRKSNVPLLVHMLAWCWVAPLPAAGVSFCSHPQLIILLYSRSCVSIHKKEQPHSCLGLAAVGRQAVAPHQVPLGHRHGYTSHPQPWPGLMQWRFLLRLAPHVMRVKKQGGGGRWVRGGGGWRGEGKQGGAGRPRGTLPRTACKQCYGHKVGYMGSN